MERRHMQLMQSLFAGFHAGNDKKLGMYIRHLLSFVAKEDGNKDSIKDIEDDMISLMLRMVLLPKETYLCIDSEDELAGMYLDDLFEPNKNIKRDVNLKEGDITLYYGNNSLNVDFDGWEELGNDLSTIYNTGKFKPIRRVYFNVDEKYNVHIKFEYVKF